jgi:hypothetical protein
MVYLLKFLDKILDETCATYVSTAGLRNVLSNPSLKFMSISYIPGLFEKFRRVFKKYDVKVVGKGMEITYVRGFSAH